MDLTHLVIVVISWIAVVGVLATYAFKREWFDWANLCLFLPVALPALLVGAFSSAAISICFGIIGGGRLGLHAYRRHWKLKWRVQQATIAHGHAFVRNVRDVTEPDCHVCGVMEIFHERNPSF
jgi:hypothetical protein